MAIFEDISVEWRGKTHVIPANRILGAIAAMEQHISFFELADISAGKRFSLSRLAAAYASVVRYAGGKAEDDEIYADLFGSRTTVEQQLAPVVSTLLFLMMPPAALKAATQDELAAQAAATVAPGPSRGNCRAAGRSSRNSTRRRSVSAAG